MSMSLVNPDKGDLEIWLNREIVPDGEVEDPSHSDCTF